MKDGHVQEVKIQHMHQSMRDKNKLAYLKEYRQAKDVVETVNHDLEFLDKVDGQFDPFESAAANIKSYRSSIGRDIPKKRKKVE